MKPYEVGNANEKMDFFVSLIKQDMDHYAKQQGKIKAWMAASMPSLNKTEAELLEELCEEYETKSYLQHEVMKELQKTLFTKRWSL